MIKTSTYPSRNRRLLVPAAGSIIFIRLYVLATLVYPGGSEADKAAKRFSWLQVGFSRWRRVMLQAAGIASTVVALFLFSEFMTGSLMWHHR